MATYTTYLRGEVIANASGANAAGFPATTVLVGEFDASQRNVTAGDVVEVVRVPAGAYVKKVFYRVLTGDATQTMDVGDGTTPNGYVSAADVATAGNIGVGAGTYASGKLYTTADTIDITVPTGKAYDTLKVRIMAEVTVV